jgi:malonyl-CoA/methylmalonyl-CoA synthetase
MLERPALDELSYGQLHETVLRYVTFLQESDLKKGDVLCLQLPKSNQLLFLMLASLALGVIVLPLNEKYTEDEVLFYLRDSGPKLSILLHHPKKWSGRVIKPSQVAVATQWSPAPLPLPVDKESVAMLLYTSGTTGKPKGAMITHGNILACVQGLHEAWKWTVADHLLHVLPLFHVHGLIVAMFGALFANARTSMMCNVDPQKIWERISTQRITVLMAVPTIHYRLLKEKANVDVSSLRLVTSGSAPLPVSIHQQFYKRFGFFIVERYGMTEVGIVLSNPYGGRCRPGTVGFPVGDTRFRIVDSDNDDLPIGEVGELLISGSSVISSYWERPEQTALTIKGGWLKSGDLARLDDQGYYSIVGRSKDLIISGGMNVYPREIERCLMQHDSVEGIAVIGVPDSEWGERVIAVVIGQENPLELLAFSASRLSSYKRPKQIYYVDEFPRNAMGKIQKAILRKKYAGVAK